MTKPASKKSTERKQPQTSERADKAKRHRDEILDEALEGTFPASDPIELTPKASE